MLGVLSEVDEINELDEVDDVEGDGMEVIILGMATGLVTVASGTAKAG
jgi:hypothetical protein